MVCEMATRGRRDLCTMNGRERAQVLNAKHNAGVGPCVRRRDGQQGESGDPSSPRCCMLHSVVDPGLLANRDRTGRIRVSSQVRSNEVVGADAPRANVERYKCARASLRL
ncbi:hypothetical protein ALC53_10553 [Atta colombica]|uniref:Uncharacterized protein n=1 Tax=Atta colombica TaxID=520822 RepID=A0A195B463_9HYME|nr:hypothetical protein ALC53_10553 [Atta colombica]